MLVGIEFKRRKIYDDEHGKDIWFWRCALYTQGCDRLRIGAIIFATISLCTIALIGRAMQP